MSLGRVEYRKCSSCKWVTRYQYNVTSGDCHKYPEKVHVVDIFKHFCSFYERDTDKRLYNE